MEFVDTHCHIHAADYELNKQEVLQTALEAGVSKMICVGTDQADSAEAITFANKHNNVWASIGLHPHDAKLGKDAFSELAKLVTQPKVVAIGECGLDYFYSHSSKKDQETALRLQVELALEHKLPIIFHVRDAFDDFWPIFDSYKDIKGVVHSFTATKKELDQALSRGLYIGLNGIMTFTKDQNQLDAAKSVPLDRLVLETDSPFLTPHPLRGRINEPKNVVITGEFLSKLQSVELKDLAVCTTQNAINLFNLK